MSKKKYTITYRGEDPSIDYDLRRIFNALNELSGVAGNINLNGASLVNIIWPLIAEDRLKDITVSNGSYRAPVEPEGMLSRDDYVKMYNGVLDVEVDYQRFDTTTGEYWKYVGLAPAGTPTSSDLWQIRRELINQTTRTVEWADSDWVYNNVWDNRLTLTYGALTNAGAVGAVGISTTFLTNDAVPKTVTVTNGIITNIV